MDATARTPEESTLPPHRDHARLFRGNRYVYPVLSRRSRGISVGINLNPDKACNFDCVYCQVDRNVAPAVREVDRPRLLAELDGTLELVRTGRLFEDPRFASVPGPLRRLNDIAFSGDGEPTTYPAFGPVVRDVAELKRRRGLGAVKLVLITNATMFDRPAVAEALATLDENRGEIWAKLDAGTEAFYRRVGRTSIPFRRVLGNLRRAALRRPIVIQSLFMTIDGEGPAPDELDAYARRLEEILEGGGRIAEVQVYTVARPPAEGSVGPLEAAELGRIGARLRERIPVPVAVFGG
ncbi:Radical SAM superfamily protein [Aquisphaera giovannonii]|uniref:Radical SAM superfamily protein n=1 Tax=Aquisphaera giovannonii TaxID=406548 RepID=A0A5B9WDD4_9BACT|nr:radical SAM protein [Aquisphaera giovannonii]QEH37890.1 Radical SAM superfamily protein [Aquisphaera giovannonii]